MSGCTLTYEDTRDLVASWGSPWKHKRPVLVDLRALWGADPKVGGAVPTGYLVRPSI